MSARCHSALISCGLVHYRLKGRDLNNLLPVIVSEFVTDNVPLHDSLGRHVTLVKCNMLHLQNCKTCTLDMYTCKIVTCYTCHRQRSLAWFPWMTCYTCKILRCTCHRTRSWTTCTLGRHLDLDDMYTCKIVTCYTCHRLRSFAWFI